MLATTHIQVARMQAGLVDEWEDLHWDCAQWTTEPQIEHHPDTTPATLGNLQTRHFETGMEDFAEEVEEAI